MLKKIWMLALVLCFVLCASACAEEFVCPFKGEGTQENPYLIETKEDLFQFAALMNDDDLYLDYYSLHYRLTADIALNDGSNYEEWGENPPETVWTPIGYYHSFRGVFDGSGHTISGLYINLPAGKELEPGKNDWYNDMFSFGLFGSTQGEIRNLNVVNAYVHPVRGERKPETGIIAGSNTGIISGCSAEGILICEGLSGGIAASSGGGTIEDCSFIGKIFVRDSNEVGGIAGYGGYIRNCSVSAQITCETLDDLLKAQAGIGGIAGTMSGDKTIENCTFNGEIISGDHAGGIVGMMSDGLVGENPNVVLRNCTNYGSVTAYEEAGGIVGYIFSRNGSGQIRLDGCTNFGNVRSKMEDLPATGGIVGYVMIHKNGDVVITGCTNEAALSCSYPGGIVSQLMQWGGKILIENCTNKGAITGEFLYAGGILCHTQPIGSDWTVNINGCVNEGDITTDHNAGGIVCFTFSVNESNSAMNITNCINRGNLRSGGINNYMGGILGVNAFSKVPVTISGCVNEGDLEYTRDVQVDAETLSGTLITLARISGGIVGYNGTAPFFSVDSGERRLNNINVEDAYLNIVNCSSTGKFIHKEARFADDVTEELLEKWNLSGYENVLNFFPALEGGIVGTIADQENYSVNISGCSYENIEREYDDWNRF